MDKKFEIRVNSDFDRARNREIWAKILSLVKNRETTLFSFQDLKTILKPTSAKYKGVQPIKISHIVGSEGRYNDFDAHFFPKSSHLRQRWVRVNKAHYHAVDLPPIRVYEIAGLYFVRDGNHRVSVAKTKKMEYIDAEILSLDSELQLEPEMSMEAIKSAVILFEKYRFMEYTRLNRYRRQVPMDFTSVGRYDELLNHINGHKYYMNLTKKYEIPFTEAMLSWHDTVFLPIIDIIRKEDLLSLFPGRTPSDLYVWICRHWHALKQKYGQDYSLEDAAKDFSVKHGLNSLNRIKRFFANLFRPGKKLSGASEESPQKES